jgi:GPH family glycoside/pentoside/hexuronide:cation symporter
VTFILGSAIGYVAPYIWGALEPSLGRVMAVRVTFMILSAIGLVALLVPTFTLREKDYVTAEPSDDNAFQSLGKTFRNVEFRKFVASDVLYFLAITIFQTGLPYFITKLMGLEETMTTLLYVAMTFLSFLCYAPVNILAHKYNKKKLVLCGFAGLGAVYAITAFSGSFGLNGMVWGGIIVVCASFPMAIMGILPQAIVADIAQADAVVTGEKREGMFFAARTFAFKMGQSVSMLLFTAFASISPQTGLGYRIAAATACVVCIAGGLILMLYNEKKVLGIIVPEEKK